MFGAGGPIVRPIGVFVRFLVSAVAFISLSAIVPSIAWAQANANATVNASDAFGFRSGDDAVGIYDEGSVRGFNLEAAGNYRVEGTYFVKNSGVSPFFIESSTVRIGYNTLNTVIPGPSGVVDYRLRDPQLGEPSFATLTLDQYSQPSAEFVFKHRTRNERASIALGFGRVFDIIDQQGGHGGRSILPAGTARLTTSAGTFRTFGGEYQYERPGQFRVQAQGSALPPRIERGRFIGQRWAMEKGQRRIAGLLFDSPETAGRGIGSTLVFSEEDPTRAFTQVLSDLQPDGSARSVIVANPHQRSTAWSGELRAHLGRSGKRLAQRFDVTLRGRISRARFGGTQIVDLGRAFFGAEAPQTQAPTLDDAAAVLRDSVEQSGLGVTHRASWDGRLRTNVGLLRTYYRKTFVGADGASRENVTSPWLYNAALAWRVNPALELYGSYSKGLEEAGVAPATATNRNEVLNAIAVTQREIGVRINPTEGIAIVVAGFDTRKPYAGIEGSSGGYRLLGAVEHRGVEASLSGRPLAGLSVVVGGVFLDPQLSGVEVDAGLIGDRPVGVPRYRAIVSIDYALQRVKGLSLDAAATAIGQRPARSALSVSGSQLEVERLASVNLGARYAFRVAGLDLVMRAQAQNVFDQYSWDVNSSETLNYSAPRQFRLLLTAFF